MAACFTVLVLSVGLAAWAAYAAGLRHGTHVTSDELWAMVAQFEAELGKLGVDRQAVKGALSNACAARVAAAEARRRDAEKRGSLGRGQA